MKSKTRWWTFPPYSTNIDPISLEPLRKLRHPPFELRPDVEQSGDQNIFFAPEILAAYFLASGQFTHPVSRRAVRREECAMLDAHLVANGLGESRVAHAFDVYKHEEVGAATVPSVSRRMARMRLEAEQVMNTLFAQPIRSYAGDSRRQPAVDESDGNLAIIDDDGRPSHTTAHVAHLTTASEQFPALPTPTAPSLRSVRPRSTITATTAKVAPAVKDVHAEAAKARRAVVADAFSRSVCGGTSFAPSAAVHFSSKALTVARTYPEMIADLEAGLDQVVQGGDGTRLALPPMPAPQRAVVSEVARLYKVATIERDQGRSRHVVLLHTSKCELPGFHLSDAAKPPFAPSVAGPSAAVLERKEPMPFAVVQLPRPFPEAVDEDVRLGHAVARAAVLAALSEDAAAAPSAVPTPAPWRGRSALLRMAAMSGDADGAAVSTTASPHDIAAASSRAATNTRAQIQARLLPAALSPRLSWDALRRLIWSSESQEEAVQRLHQHGFSLTACHRAIALAGEVDDETRRAAASEWLLQHCEFLFCQQNGLPCTPLEPANPWALNEGIRDQKIGWKRVGWHETDRRGSAAERRLITVEEETDDDDDNVLGCSPRLRVPPRTPTSAAEHDDDNALGGLLPRDYLQRPHKRWRKDQVRRGIRDLACAARAEEARALGVANTKASSLASASSRDV